MSKPTPSKACGHCGKPVHPKNPEDNSGWWGCILCCRTVHEKCSYEGGQGHCPNTPLENFEGSVAGLREAETKAAQGANALQMVFNMAVRLRSERDALRALLRSIADPTCPTCGGTGDADPSGAWAPCACVTAAVELVRQVRAQGGLKGPATSGPHSYGQSLQVVCRANAELAAALMTLQANAEVLMERLQAGGNHAAAEEAKRLLIREAGNVL